MATDARSDLLLQAALEYAGYGWRVVPLYGVRGSECTCHRRGSCKSAGKHPVWDSWQTRATCDESQLIEQFETWQGNIGVALGEASGIIDIECDSAEAEKTLGFLFDGNVPVAPTFQSRRGKHRIFKWQDNLPGFGKAVFKLGDLEIRTGNGEKGAQSVFPPSQRADGSTYSWLQTLSPEEVEPPLLPPVVIVRMANMLALGGEDAAALVNGERSARPKSKRMRLYEEETIPQGDQDNVIYAEACAEWREQLTIRGPAAFDDPDIQARVFRRLWCFNVAMCKPEGLDRDRVQEKCNNALDFVRKQVSEDDEKKPSLAALGLEYRDGEWWPGQWRVEVLDSDPPFAQLYAPFLKDRFVKMPLAVFYKPEGVDLAVLEATLGRVPLDDRPGFWPSVWRGRKGNKKEGIAPTVGLRVKLLRAATHLESDPDQKTQGMLAELVLEKIRAEIKKGGLTEPKADAAVQKMDDGTVLIRFQKLLADLRFTYRDVQRNDLSELFKSTRVVRMPWKGGVVGYYHVKDEHRKALEKLTN